MLSPARPVYQLPAGVWSQDGRPRGGRRHSSPGGHVGVAPGLHSDPAFFPESGGPRSFSGAEDDQNFAIKQRGAGPPSKAKARYTRGNAPSGLLTSADCQGDSQQSELTSKLAEGLGPDVERNRPTLNEGIFHKAFELKDAGKGPQVTQKAPSAQLSAADYAMKVDSGADISMTIRVDRVLSPPALQDSGEYGGGMGHWTAEEAARKSYQVPAGRLRMAKKFLPKRDQQHASQKNYHTVRPCAVLLQPTLSQPHQGGK